MKRNRVSRCRKARQLAARSRMRRRRAHGRPPAAYRQRGRDAAVQTESFNAPEIWHDAVDSETTRYVVHPAGRGYYHPVTTDEVRERVELLPQKFLQKLEVVQFSRMTSKRALFPCYGMQWGTTVYLYPIEDSLVETYFRPPTPQQLIEANMYGGRWSNDGELWTLEWTEKTLRDFYLNNILIHEIGHINDERNASFNDRERYANWFAIEYGYRASRGRLNS